MSYQSPLHIIKGIAEKDFEINPTNLVRLRKQLLADLNLSGATTITIQKKTFTKDEIIKTIDVLINTPDLALHEYIYNDKGLLNYFENEDLKYTRTGYDRLSIPDNIKTGLNNLFQQRIITQFKKGLSKRIFKQAEEAITLVEVLDEDNKQICYESIHKSLKTLDDYLLEIDNSIRKNNLREISIRKPSITAEQFDFLGNIYFADMLNALPAHFNELAIEICNGIINLMYSYHKQVKYDKKVTSKISHMLMKVKFLDKALYDLIRSNHRFYGQTPVSEKGKASSGFYILFVVIAIILKIAVCNHRSSSNYIDYKKIEYTDINELLKSISKPQSIMINYRAGVGLNFPPGKLFFESTQYDKHDIKTGENPFFDSKFNTADTAYWDNKIFIKNKTSCDLILFNLDSAKQNISSNFIKSKEELKISFNNKNKFFFFFGNKFVTPDSATRSDYLYYEQFSEIHKNSLKLLGKEYEINISGAKNKKGKYTLALNDSMLEQMPDSIINKNIKLIYSKENNTSTTLSSKKITTKKIDYDKYYDSVDEAYKKQSIENNKAFQKKLNQIDEDLKNNLKKINEKYSKQMQNINTENKRKMDSILQSGRQKTAIDLEKSDKKYKRWMDSIRYQQKLKEQK